MLRRFVGILRDLVSGEISIGILVYKLINRKSRFGNDDFIRINLSGFGLEVGALSSPFKFSRNTKVDYADVYTADEVENELNQIPIPNLYIGKLIQPTVKLNQPRFGFDSVPDNHYDFVFSSHVLEHSPNILYSLQESIRIVKKSGVVYGVIPDKNYTYDVMRQTVPLDVLVQRFKNQEFDIPTAYVEDLLMNTTNHPMYEDKTTARLEELIQNPSSMHHYFVYDCGTVITILNWMQSNFSITIEYFWSAGQNIHFMIQKQN
jgi:hypothetical protein